MTLIHLTSDGSKKIKKITFLFLAVIFSLAICELITAKFFPQETLNFRKAIAPTCFSKSEFLPFVLKKSTTCFFNQAEFNHPVHINSLGYRNREFDKERKGNIFRILILGDSFTFGHGVGDNETYPFYLEELFKKDKKSIEVINGGYVSSFSPDSYYLYLKKFGMELKPDLVVLGFFIWNDITDLRETFWEKIDSEGLPLKISSNWQEVDEEGRLKFKKSKPRYRLPILRNSHLFQLIYSYKQSFFDKVINLFDPNPAFNPEKESMAIYDTCIFKDDCFSQYFLEWQKTQKVILATKTYLDDLRTPLLVVLIPTKEQLTEGGCCGWEELTEKEKLSVNRKLIEFFKQNKITYLDLYPDFKGQDIKSLYYEKDAHWTPKGHLKAAQAIYQALSLMKF